MTVESDIAAASLREVARAVWAGDRSASAFTRAFGASTVYVQRPTDTLVKLLTVDIPGSGVVVLAFSSLEALGRFAGECDWMCLTGQDLLANLPDQVGVVVDIQDQHRLTLPPRSGDGDSATKAVQRHG